MFIKDVKFIVKLNHYAKSHFCKDFSKKYSKKQWNITLENIMDLLERSYSLQEKSLFSVLNFSQKDKCGIFKLEFRVAGTNMSAKGSGNRVIFFVDNKNQLIEILIVYGKTNSSKNETQWIKEQIKDNMPQYKKYCI